MMDSAIPDSPVERIRHNLVALRMPRALEALDAVIQQLERGQVSAIEAIDTLLVEEITVREGRRIKAVLQMARHFRFGCYRTPVSKKVRADRREFSCLVRNARTTASVWSYAGIWVTR